jgi:hypothetical protein
MPIEKVQDAQEEPIKVVERTETKKPVAKTDISSPSISMEEVYKLLEEQNARFEERIKSITETKAAAPTDSTDELLNDYMDEPATFFVFATQYSILGDKVRGVETTPPHGKIKFSNVLRTRTRTSNGEKIISVASHVTNSKSTAEWLRKCSAFGYEIFEDMNTVQNIDAVWAQRLVQSSNVVNNFSDHAVISRCKLEGIPISTDIPELRRTLTTMIAKKNDEQYKELLNKKLKNSKIEDNRIIVPSAI